MTQNTRPALPQPGLARWQPLRLGLVDLFLYDSEEFWFRDGRLLLRGNNGTGKSKVLSLTLPFLLDAQLKPSRIEPDGDPGKKMAWNLLLGRHERRTGYVWIEFGRLAEDGTPHYLTLGCGLSAAAARPSVDSWFFLMERGRIGQDLWLTSAHRIVLTRERLREAIEPLGGQLLPTATEYRRAVDERLFHLGALRYAALMDTLIQLRQPQLSRKPDEASLSRALTEALPPLPNDLLADVAEALNQLEEYRRELAEYEALAHAVERFNRHYQTYAATQARRQARALRSAQTGFDNASRELHDSRLAWEQAQAAETAAITQLDGIQRLLASARVRLEALQNDPAMAGAKQLEAAEREAERRADDAARAEKSLREAQGRRQRETEASRSRARRAEEAGRTLGTQREEAAQAAAAAGLAQALATNPLADRGTAAMDGLSLETARRGLRHAVSSRREQVELLLKHIDAVDRSADRHHSAQQHRDLCNDEANAAAERRASADNAVLEQAQALLDAWQSHFDGLQQLQPPEASAALEGLFLWSHDLQGDNPARAALSQAQQASALRLAQRRSQLDAQQAALLGEQAALRDERERLGLGEDAEPPAPHWRADTARSGRPGAPLWQLIDFQPQLGASERAGLEAALQASGLLDAWVCADGTLLSADGAPLLHDSQWLARPPQAASLTAWLQAAPGTAVAPDRVQGLLKGVACAEQDDTCAEAWLSPQGRFRLGALNGAWSKPSAEFIGYAARAAARDRRLRQIDERLIELAEQLQSLQQSFVRLEAAQQQASHEWQSAPTDEGLRGAHAQASACAREFEAARQRLDQAERLWRAAAEAWTQAQQTLARDADDLSLPRTRVALQAVTQALQALGDAVHALASAAREWQEAAAELELQREREREAGEDERQAREEAGERLALADEAQVHWQTLNDAIGAEVDAMRQRLEEARGRVREGAQQERRHSEARRLAGEARAKAEQRSVDATALLNERIGTRQQAVAQLQGFAATGLLAVALPDAEQPAHTGPWTIEPTLNLARRTEQSLADLKDDDETWSRVQAQVSQEYTDLGRALAALSHRAQADASDYGFVVHVVYQNRPERPDRLGLRLAGEIAQRRELLTAGEREVLENHLQAEIAATVQRLLREAEHQVVAINSELHKRPTSTGVRFRLQWQTLPEGSEGAPVGLEAARRRLLNVNADLWSAEDRRAVGDMLQQRIAAERSHADAEQGGSLLDQLTRALDYRRWHRFRVQRWQDGQWRPLSGPASSGERALGLTVPLFAAVSSFYGQAGNALAPRLVLLDEAFAGIDDAARAHCWALIREFDLDFVITSEREWACSAELPGVAIAQLQRREGVDAVHVSRWVWDGRARRREDDPDRRFPPTPAHDDSD